MTQTDSLDIAAGNIATPFGDRVAQGTLQLNNVALQASWSFGFAIWLSIMIPGHLFSWMLEWVFVVLVAVLSLFSRRTTHLLFSAFTPAHALIGSLTLTAFWSVGYLWSSMFLLTDTGVRDIAEGIRYILCLLFLVYIGSNFNPSTRSSFDLAVLVSLAWSLVCLVASITSIPGLTWVTHILYASTKTNVSSTDNYYRLSAPFSNPNFLGFYLTLVLAYLLFFYKAVAKIPAVFVTLALLFFTGSRSSWFGSLFVLAVFCVSAMKDCCKKRGRHSLLTLAFIVGGGALMWQNYSETILSSGRVRMLLSAESVGSIAGEENAAARVVMVEDAFNMLKESPIFGWGSAKYSGAETIDNQLFTWLVRYGLLGSGIILIWLGGIFVLHVVAASHSGSALGVVAFWGGAGIVLQSGAFFDNFRLFFLFWCFVAAIGLDVFRPSLRCGD